MGIFTQKVNIKHDDYTKRTSRLSGNNNNNVIDHNGWRAPSLCFSALSIVGQDIYIHIKIGNATYGKVSPIAALSSQMISNIWRKLLNYLTDVLKCIQKRPCFLVSCQNIFQIFVFLCLSHIGVAADVKSFDPNILHPHTVYSLCIQCAKAFTLRPSNNTRKWTLMYHFFFPQWTEQ